MSVECTTYDNYKSSHKRVILKTIKGEVTNFLYFKDKSFLKYALIVATGGNLMILDIEGHSNVYYSHPVHCGLPLLYGLLKKIYPLKYGQMSPLQETHWLPYQCST